jgi:hypothetical protein
MEQENQRTLTPQCFDEQNPLRSDSPSCSEQTQVQRQSFNVQHPPPPSASTEIYTPSAFTSRPNLATSEPSLRFPRPVGSRHLANWISTSDPDIMRMTTTPADESSLAGSTYELISGTDDESWSHDGRDQDIISESVSSLDAQRTDDVHSIADTEHMTDDEYTHVAETSGRSNRHHTKAAQGNPSLPVVSRNGQPHDDDEVESDSEDDDDESRSSLEYAQESLKTPSIPTPEASNIFERPIPKVWSEKNYKTSAADEKDGRGVFKAVNHYFDQLWEAWQPSNLAREDVFRISKIAAPWLVLLMGACLIPHLIVSRSPAQEPMPPTTTVYVTTTAVAPAPLLLSSSTNVPARPMSTSSDLIPIENAKSNDWGFRSKNADVYFSTPSNTKLVAHIHNDVKQTWLAHDCLEIVSSREGRSIAMTVVPVDEGLLVKFPRSEAYGVVDVSFRATCKPNLHRVLKVHFGKGILEEVYEMTKHIAHDLTEFVPVAAQEAERRLGNAKRSWDSVTDSLSTTALTVTNTLSKTVSTWMDASTSRLLDTEAGVSKLAECLSRYVSTAQKEANEYLHELGDTRLRVQSSLQLELLQTQIAAKIWWLHMAGREEERAAYQDKAKVFIAEKQNVAKKLLEKSKEDRGGDKTSLFSVADWFRKTGEHKSCSSQEHGKAKGRKIWCHGK